MPTKKKTSAGIWITHRPKRKSSFLVCWRDPITKKQRSLSFPTKPNAENYKKFLTQAQKEHGNDILRFNPDTWRKWLAFEEQLLEIDPNLTPNDVLEHYKQTFNRGPSDKLTTFTIASDFIEHTKQRWERGLIGKDRYTHVKKNIGRLAEAFDRTPFQQLEPEDLNEWLDDLSEYHADTTVRNHFKDLKSLYLHCLKHGKIRSNPVELIEAPFVAHKEHKPMPIAQAKQLLKANFQANPIGLGRLACEMFAGLRTSSAGRLEKKDINFEDKGITLPAAKLKTGIQTGIRHYITGLPAPLWEWLKLTPKECWEMTEKQYATWKSNAFTTAKVPHPPNIIRHTAATYLLYATQDPPKVSAILCHKDSDLLWNTYKGNATERAGKEYLALSPKKVLG